MLCKNYSNVQVDDEELGWIRLTPNLVLAKPRVVLTTGLNLLPGKNIVNISNQVPIEAIVLNITISFNLLSIGEIGAISGFTVHTMWDNVNNASVCDGSLMKVHEQAITAPGTVLSSQSFSGKAPVIDSSFFVVTISPLGGSFTNLPIKVASYYA